jgi:crotonobetainyl-CoA:carnitine CoA-transferase CaiB-like acyl-CoA transferase
LNAGRVVHRDELIAALSATFATGSVAHWMEKLAAVGVPAGPVQTLDQVVAHPQTRAMGMMVPSPDGEFATLGLPVSFDGVRPVETALAPGLGEHDAVVLGGD